MLADWARMAPLVVEFCEAHGTAEVDPFGATGTLPLWAAQMLGHMVSRAKQEGREGAPPVSLDALLVLLRLVRRYRARPTPDARFFTWAAHQLVLHREAGSAEDELLAEAVSELVPRLPEAERGQLARLLVASPSGPRAAAAEAAQRITPGTLLEVMTVAPTANMATSRLLKTAQAQRQLLHGGVRLATAVKAPEEISRAVQEAPVVASQRRSGRSSGQLWGLLASGPTPGPSEDEAKAATAAGAHEVPQLLAQSPEAGEAETGVLVHSAPTTERDMSELRSELEQAIERVGRLEAKLEERLLTVEQAATASPSSSGGASASSKSPRVNSKDSAPDGAMDCSSPGTPLQNMGWGGAPSSLGAPAFAGGVAGAAVLSGQTQPYFYRPFNFEAFRQANTKQLQAERRRVLVPPDHFPLWPLSPLPRK